MPDLISTLSPSLLFTLMFSLSLLLGLLLKFWLCVRQIKHVRQHRHAVPTAFSQHVSLAAHHKAADYTFAKASSSVLELTLSAALVLAWTLLGGLNALNHNLMAWLGVGLVQQVALLVVFALISALLDLPLSWYQTFVIEARFGFNRMSLRLWLTDLLKSMAMALVIGLPLASLVLWLMGSAGTTWWLWAWGLWMGFNLLLLLIYPTWIAPLFNQFKPLEDQALKQRVTTLMARCGFAAKGLFVMDGSKRSAHANAYFTGFGAAKRVVFYDTLLAKLLPGEVDAVLAHELGHFKHRHVLKRMVVLFSMSFLGFALLGWIAQAAWFYTGLGVQPLMVAPNNALALLLFMLSMPVFSFFVTPLLAQLSRQHEFEADAYAVAQTSGADLQTALLRLFEDNASTLTPDPVYARFYYSHPPAAERLARIAA